MNKAEKARNLRYRRPALAMMRRDSIVDELWEISEECESLEYAIEDDEKLEEAFDGDSDEIHEFKMRFSDLTYRCDRLREALCENEVNEHFDDFFVGLLGRAYEVVGFDHFEEDYFNLTRFESQFANETSKKRLMSMTKEQLIATAGQCVGTFVSFLDVRHEYDSLKSTLDILRDERAEVMKSVKSISEAWEKLQENQFNRDAARHYEALLERLPDIAWVQ